jgi:uncharacterized membrane protein
LQVAGLLTIVLTAGKLLVFDLGSVATIWRVILFLAFGAVLLVISYVVAKANPQSREAS